MTNKNNIVILTVTACPEYRESGAEESHHS